VSKTVHERRSLLYGKRNLLLVSLQVLSPLQDHCIPRLLGCGDLPFESAFLAMSYIDGAPLSELSVISEQCKREARHSLTALHKHGMAHGDVQLHNLVHRHLPSPTRGSSAGTREWGSGIGGGSSGSDASQHAVSPPGASDRQAHEGGHADALPATPAASAQPASLVVVVDLGCSYLCSDAAVFAAEVQQLELLIEAHNSGAGQWSRPDGLCNGMYLHIAACVLGGQ
jgi:hypothetical protein